MNCFSDECSASSAVKALYYSPKSYQFKSNDFHSAAVEPIRKAQQPPIFHLQYMPALDAV